MLHRVLAHRPSPAMVVACVALVVALGGTGYAAIKLPRDSVGTSQLRDGAVTGAKVRDGALRAADFAGRELPRGPRGPQGPLGPGGPMGATGPAGTPAPSAAAGFASRTFLPPGPSIGNAPVDVLQLGVGAGSAGYISSSGLVTAGAPGRLIADAQMTYIGTLGAPGDLSCQLVLVQAATTRTIGAAIGVVVAGGKNVVAAGGGADVDAGTYDVRMRCFQDSEGALSFVSANITVHVATR